MGEFSRVLASHVQDVANWFLIGSLIIGVVSTFLVVWTGNVKESYLKKDVASANAVAEKAKADAANANEKTAELNTRALEIERGNIQLKSNLEKSIIEADLEKQKLAKMQIEVADARRKQAEAEKSLEELRLRIKPRTLNPQQRVDMANLLSQFPNQLIYVHYLTADQDTKELSELILNILHSSQWKVILSTTGITNVPVYGITIEAGPTSAANALTSSLRKAGLQIKLKPSSDTHKIHISIGLKPIE